MVIDHVIGVRTIPLEHSMLSHAVENPQGRHGEERSEEAIQHLQRRTSCCLRQEQPINRDGDWIASLRSQ
jgi:hypothetical protein